MSNDFPLLVAGNPIDTGRLQVTAPYDGSTIAEVATANSEHINSALHQAYSLYQHRHEWLSLNQRIGILEKTIQLMKEQQQALAIEAAREGGKPLTDSQVEVSRAIAGLKICIETLTTQAGQVVPMGATAASKHHLAFTQKEPIGVVVAVSAFNHPLNLIIHQVAAAVAAGCPVIVKPATDTPLSCLRFVQILRQAGLADAWCQVIVTDQRQLAQQLVTDPRVSFFSFIGSAALGWKLRSLLAPGTRCALEHGGVAPLIAAADAELDQLIPALTKGGYYHAGQVCVSVQRVFAHSSIIKPLAEKLTQAVQALNVGDPTLETTDVGPLIRPAEVKRVQQWVNEAVNGGAQLLTGGQTINPHCYQPTLLLDPPPQAKVSQQEVFGPVICLYSYQHMDEAISAANSLPYAFQGAIFTQHLDTALQAYKQLNASAVMVNQHTAFRVDGMPFAGLKQSGLGVGGIPHTMADMQIDKMLVIRSKEI